MTVQRSLDPPDDATYVTALPMLGSLRFEGPDAATFLQAQLSSDVRALTAGTLQRSSYVSPKGRVLASLLLWRTARADAGIGSLVSADLAAATARRLAMFVLRAKVKVVDPGAYRARLGVAGAGAAAAVTAVLGRAPARGEALDVDDAALLGLSDGRIVIDVEAARADALRASLAPHTRPGDEQAWQLAQVRSGVPLVSAATADAFVPQALNLDALDAVSFQKGCYPGQEIVARTQYLGRLKERLYAFRLHGPAPAPGTRLFADAFGDQPCGTVVNAAPVGATGVELLAVAQRAADAEALHVGAPDGPLLERIALPYPVPEPAQPRGRPA